MFYSLYIQELVWKSLTIQFRQSLSVLYSVYISGWVGVNCWPDNHHMLFNCLKVFTAFVCASSSYTINFPSKDLALCNGVCMPCLYGRRPCPAQTVYETRGKCKTQIDSDIKQFPLIQIVHNAYVYIQLKNVVCLCILKSSTHSLQLNKAELHGDASVDCWLLGKSVLVLTSINKSGLYPINTTSTSSTCTASTTTTTTCSTSFVLVLQVWSVPAFSYSFKAAVSYDRGGYEVQIFSFSCHFVNSHKPFVKI